MDAAATSVDINATANYFSEWADSLASSAKRAKLVIYFWKFMSFLPVPVGMVSWAIGAYSLAVEPDLSSDQQPQQKNTTSDIALLVVGGVSVFLERMKPRKYLVDAKLRHRAYMEAERYLRLQLAMPASERPSPLELHSAIISKLSEVEGTEHMMRQQEESGASI